MLFEMNYQYAMAEKPSLSTCGDFSYSANSFLNKGNGKKKHPAPPMGRAGGTAMINTKERENSLTRAREVRIKQKPITRSSAMIAQNLSLCGMS